MKKKLTGGRASTKVKNTNKKKKKIRKTRL
jgi:hypothetical protein